MKRKTALFPGLSLFLCFCLLTGSGALATYFGGGTLLIAASELISFALPMLLLWVTMRQRERLSKRLRPKPLPKGAIGFSVKLGVTVAVLSLFLNFLIYQLVGLAGADLSATALDAPQTGLTALGRVAVIVVLSSLVEELYLRGSLLAAHEQLAGTGACLLVSGIAFAMLHGSLMNFIGPMVAGVAYAYLSYSFGSLWPAIIAHAVNNIYYVLVVWITETYSAFGIWNYFAAVNALILLLFLYLTLRAAERLLVRGSIPHFEKGAGRRDFWRLTANPGFLVFVLAFVAKAVLHWI
ncbi:CPBP family intramembrane glutamic endopeptidase [Agathobaculum sp. NTUH-O15-33]|uniref:CPBP family intramembrane glutamic endopeptidase n=1 Tax=Agathobaculum sp. NTUH-O15-33 TaxID=3079302 RepID=UPI002958844F|nr:CPBP family intramembrane glutamic endopeptidase [Agathobaculum sp. NTUH-O15-33]WNX86465.1 CPBP family intramembrane glutamic endopeptidase [Agathobaculum sp. NTUH-O15-33]